MLKLGNYYFSWKYDRTYFQGKLVEAITTCEVFNDPKGIPIHVADATWSPKDKFSKDQGRKVSLGRAIQFLPTTERRIIWNAYLNRGNHFNG